MRGRLHVPLRNCKHQSGVLFILPLIGDDQLKIRERRVSTIIESHAILTPQPSKMVRSERYFIIHPPRTDFSAIYLYKSSLVGMGLPYSTVRRSTQHLV